MTCEDCIHREICEKVHYFKLSPCLNFKDKLQYIESPCKIGDTVYHVCPYGDENKFEIDKGEVCAISFTGEMCISVRYESGIRYDHPRSVIGKNVFLSLLEAEDVAYKLNHCCCAKDGV